MSGFVGEQLNLLKQCRQKELLELLETRSKSNPIKADEIQAKLYISPRQTRMIVNYLRRKGHLIGSCDNGYYYCRTADEASETIMRLHSMAMDLLVTLSKMEKQAKEIYGIHGTFQQIFDFMQTIEKDKIW